LFLPLSLDELSRGVATVIPHFDRSGGVTVGSHQINNKNKYNITKREAIMVKYLAISF
jgi:hypothetical protein